MFNVAVVGSGPSSAIAAAKLSKLGHKVTVVDVGLTLDTKLLPLTVATENLDYRQYMKRIETARLDSRGRLAKMPAKLPFGSEFAYRSVKESAFEHGPAIEPVYSLAKGGLSNAWGSNISGVMAKDLVDWPFQAEELTSHFIGLSEYVSCAGEVDLVDTNYPFHLASIGETPHRLGIQGSYVLQKLRSARSHLEELGIFAGRSKLAIGTKYSYESMGCRQCGLCMHGCTYRAIFNSAYLVDALAASGRISYLPGHLVTRFDESGGSVKLECIQLGLANKKVTLEFDRIFIGAGALRSTVLVKNSISTFPDTVEIKDSQKYLYPLLLDKPQPGSTREYTNTLAQIYIQIKDLESSRNSVHSQLYDYNDLILEPIRQRLGQFAAKIAGSAARPLLERLMIGMVYLDSHDSGTLKLTFNREALPKITGQSNPRSRLVMKEFLTKLKSARREFGGRPLSIGIETNLPGGSQHFGSSMPMSKNPGLTETDIQGRPAGLSLVHIIDTSVLPSITATPTTYLIMANASRIVECAVALPKDITKTSNRNQIEEQDGKRNNKQNYHN